MARARITKTAVSRLFDAAATPIYVVDGRRTLIYCNPALANWLGMPREELLGTRCDYGYGAGDAQDAAHAALAGLCPPPDSFSGRQTRAAAFAPSRDGVVARRQGDFVPLHDVDGKLLGVVATLETLDAAATGQGAEPSESAVRTDHWHELVHAVRARLGQQFQLEQLIGVSAAARRVQQQIRLAAGSSVWWSMVRRVAAASGWPARSILPVRVSTARRWSRWLARCSMPSCSKQRCVRLCNGWRSWKRNSRRRCCCSTLIDCPLTRRPSWKDCSRLTSWGSAASRRAASHCLNWSSGASFRSDLAHAMSVLEVALPGLSERQEDIPLLAQWFVERFNAEGGPRQIAGFESTALEQLIAYPWPRNVDELQEVVAETIRRSEGPLLRCEDLPRQIWLGLDAVTHPTRDAGNIPLDELLQRVERHMITSALAHTKGNKAEAARRLGVTRQRLLRRIAQLGLAHDDAQ